MWIIFIHFYVVVSSKARNIMFKNHFVSFVEVKGGVGVGYNKHIIFSAVACSKFLKMLTIIRPVER